MLYSIFEQLFFTSYGQVSDQQERLLFYEELDGQNCLIGHNFLRSDDLVLVSFIIVLLFKIIDVEFYDIFVMGVIQERQFFFLVELVISFLSCLLFRQVDKFNMVALVLLYVLSLLAAPLWFAANGLVNDRTWRVISVLGWLKVTESVGGFLFKVVYINKVKL